MTRGRIEAICRSRKGRQVATSSAFGFRLSGGSALHDVRDVDVRPAAVEALLDHLVELRAGGAHEGFALAVLFTAGAFADEHDLGVRPADAEHDALPLFREAAAGAPVEVRPDRVERFGGGRAGSRPRRPGQEVGEAPEQAQAGGELGAEAALRPAPVWSRHQRSVELQRGAQVLFPAAATRRMRGGGRQRRRRPPRASASIRAPGG